MNATRIRAEEIAAEQEFVDAVYRRLSVVRADAEAVFAEGMERGRHRHRAGLVERDAMTYHAARRMRTLDAEYEGLVFGRLDLTDGTVRRIGRLGLRSEALSTMLVDWRAPAAAAFYQATAEAPMEVIRRRVIRCAGPTVQDVDDELLGRSAPGDLRMVGEGALMAALTRARDTTMRDIVATIQREQDEAIRAPQRGVTEIFGGPGTGKTAVALHRAAYLLYADRERYTSTGVLLVGPSDVFVSYISHVLPSLGEETVELRTVGGLLDGVVASHRDAPEVAAVKGSSRMAEVLHRLVRQAPPGVPAELRVVHSGEVLRLDAGELDQARLTALAPGQPPNSTRVHAAEALIDALYERALRYADDRYHPDRAQLFEDMLDRREFRQFLLAWWPFTEPAQVLAWLADAGTAARVGDGILTPDEVRLLSQSYAHLSAPGASGDDAAATRWSVGDVALLDEIRELLGDPPTPKRPPPPDPDEPRELSTWADRQARIEVRRPPHYGDYGLVVLDEAQDLSPMQWRMLRRRGRYADWTIVGDPAQSSWPDVSEATRARDEALHGKTRRRYHLPINYRNSAEIFAVAAGVVDRDVLVDSLPRAVRVTGIAPVLRTVAAGELPAAVRRATAELRDAVSGTVGVVCAMPAVAEVESWLAEVPAGTTVLGSLDAKGLEFDGVLVVEPAQILSEATTGRRGLYVALSRATHRLTVLDTDPSWRPQPAT